VTRIGVQSMMLKDDFAEYGVFETLRRMNEIGYRVIEVSQLPMTPQNVHEIDRARTELGVTVAAISAQLTRSSGFAGESLSTDFDKIVADAKRLGAPTIRMGILPRDAMSSLELVLKFCDRANDMAARLLECGLELCYHNHHIEFAKCDGRLLLDVMVERAPLLGLEIDVHWAQRGGLDPVTTLRRYASRVSMVHLKDYRIGWMPAVDQAMPGQSATSSFMDSFLGVVQFAEVGEGNLDFAAIVRESLAIGARYLLVEQDERYGRKALECLKTSHDNLVALGFSNLF
jgi:sugar phosphate isomerase/epimerase